MSFAQVVLLSALSCCCLARCLASLASHSSLSFHSFSFFFFFFCLRYSSSCSFFRSESFLDFFDWDQCSCLSSSSWNFRIRSLPTSCAILAIALGVTLEGPLGVPLFPDVGFFFFCSGLSGCGLFSGEGV